MPACPKQKKERHMLLANCMLSKTPVYFIKQKLCFSPTVCFQNARLSHTTKEKRTCFWPTVYCKNACLFHKTEARCLCSFQPYAFKMPACPIQKKEKAHASGKLYAFKNACLFHNTEALFLSNCMLSKCMPVPYDKRKTHVFLANCLLQKRLPVS
jgi:hypothetical protein